jgi:carboxylesterase type B
VYKFSNIRYAQSPEGNLRFRAPVAPLSDRGTVHNGSEIRVCPQGVPAWQASAFIPTAEYEAGKPFTLEAWEASIASSSPIPGLNFNANAMEDCLFLDVHVSLNAFNNASTVVDAGEGAPVLVWVSVLLISRK